VRTSVTRKADGKRCGVFPITATRQQLELSICKKKKKIKARQKKHLVSFIYLERKDLEI
jgi:hypothetical protein